MSEVNNLMLEALQDIQEKIAFISSDIGDLRVGISAALGSDLGGLGNAERLADAEGVE